MPEPVGDVVTSNVAKSPAQLFLGVSIIAAFNAVVIGLAAWVVGVPLAGTIAVITFVGAYVPFVGAWVAAGFAVLIALGTEGTDAALIMAVVSLLEKHRDSAGDPAVHDGRDAEPQPAHGNRGHNRRRRLFGMVG